MNELLIDSESDARDVSPAMMHKNNDFMELDNDFFDDQKVREREYQLSLHMAYLYRKKWLEENNLELENSDIVANKQKPKAKGSSPTGTTAEEPRHPLAVNVQPAVMKNRPIVNKTQSTTLLKSSSSTEAMVLKSRQFPIVDKIQPTVKHEPSNVVKTQRMSFVKTTKAKEVKKKIESQLSTGETGDKCQPQNAIKMQRIPFKKQRGEGDPIKITPIDKKVAFDNGMKPVLVKKLPQLTDHIEPINSFQRQRICKKNINKAYRSNPAKPCTPIVGHVSSSYINRQEYSKEIAKKNELMKKRLSNIKATVSTFR